MDPEAGSVGDLLGKVTRGGGKDGEAGVAGLVEVGGNSNSSSNNDQTVVEETANGGGLGFESGKVEQHVQPSAELLLL